MAEDKTGYRKLMKASSLFGGVQAIQILINLIRSKLVAVLLGPAGMGVNGLLMSSLTLMTSLTSFGLATSAARNIAAAKGQKDEVKVRKTATILRTTVWGTGLLGTVLTFGFSGLLSESSFGDRSYSWAFKVLAVTLLFNQISAGQGVLMRGMGELKLMAKNSLAGAFIGLILSLPFYYLYGIQGLVPAIFVNAVANLVICSFYSSRINLPKAAITLTELKQEGGDMLKMGIMLSLNWLISLVTAHLARLFVSDMGGLEQVGFYSAGFAIVNSYVGMVFTAMSTDFYPRLSGKAHDDREAGILINQQGEIALLLLGPLLGCFILFMPGIIKLIYSSQFLEIRWMIQWAALGILFKAGSWAMGFLALAKGNSKLYFFNELATNTYLLLFNITGYYLWGLEGLGAAFLLGYTISFIQQAIVNRQVYGFVLDGRFWRVFTVEFSLLALLFIVVFYSDKLGQTLWAPTRFLFLVLLIVFSAFKLIKRLELEERILRFLGLNK